MGKHTQMSKRLEEHAIRTEAMNGIIKRWMRRDTERIVALQAQIGRLQRAYLECEAWANPPGDGESHRYEYHGLHPTDLEPIGSERTQ
jgi:hypothetical protein